MNNLHDIVIEVSKAALIFGMAVAIYVLLETEYKNHKKKKPF